MLNKENKKTTTGQSKLQLKATGKQTLSCALFKKNLKCIQHSR
jgi:hypothetical protein